MEFTVCKSELMSEGALTSFTVYDADCNFVVIDVKKVGHTENI